MGISAKKKSLEVSVFGRLWNEGSRPGDTSQTRWTIQAFQAAYRKVAPENPMPDRDTLQNWISGKTVPQARFRSGIMLVFFGSAPCKCGTCERCKDRRDCEQFLSGQKLEPSRSKQLREWYPDKSLEWPSDHPAMVSLSVHESFGDQPDLKVSLGYDAQAGKLPDEDGSPTIRFTIQPMRLELKPHFEEVSMIPGTILNTERVSFGISWKIAATASNDHYPLDGERLVRLAVNGRAPVIKLIARCLFNELKVSILDEVPDATAKDLRILERALQIWGVENNQVYVTLAKGRLRPKDDPA